MQGMTTRTLILSPEEREAAGEVADDRGVSINSLVREPLVKMASGEYSLPPQCCLELIGLEFPTPRNGRWRLEVRVPEGALRGAEIIYGLKQVKHGRYHSWTMPLMRFSLQLSMGWQTENRVHRGYTDCLVVHKDVEPDPWILFEKDLEGAPRHVRWRNASRMLADGWPRERVAAINRVHWTNVRMLHEQYLATGKLYY